MASKQTLVTVRVIAKDGKFLGDDIGGSLVTIRNVETGVMLAQGYTKGGSGNTTQIMETPRTRSQPIPTDEASEFTARLEIDEPAFIEVTAYGPIGGLQSPHKVSATQWVMPGKNMTRGDAFLLEIPGLLVQVLEPPTHLSLSSLPANVTISANVMMMCGCPISPGGVWNSEHFEIAAQIRKEGKIIDTVKLVYAGSPSQFTGSWTVKRKGYYEAIVYAFQPATGNTGLGRVTFFYMPD